MKNLIVALALMAAAIPVKAGKFYDNVADASSATLRVAGIIRINDPAAPYLSKITINGVNGVITATTFAGNATSASALAANGSNCSAGQAARGVDASGAAEDCFAAGGGDFVNSAANTATGANIFTSTNAFNSRTNFTNTYSTQAIFSGFSALDGANASNGLILIGGNNSATGAIDYSAGGSQNLTISNTYDAATALIRFMHRTAGTPVTSLSMNSASSSFYGSTMTVTQTGIVSALSQPFVIAQVAGSIIKQNAQTDIFFDAVSPNRGNMWGGASSSNTFTVPTGGGGVYDMKAQFYAPAVAGTWETYLYKNGGVAKYCIKATSTAQNDVACGAKLLLADGDIIKVAVYQSGTLDLSHNPGIAFSWFEMVKLW